MYIVLYSNIYTISGLKNKQILEIYQLSTTLTYGITK